MAPCTAGNGGLNPELCTWQASTLPLSNNPSHFLFNFIYLRWAFSKSSRLAWSPVGFAFVIVCWVYRALSPSPHEAQALGLTSYFLDSQDQFLPCLYLSDPWLPTSTEFHFTRDPMYSLHPLALHGLRTLAKIPTFAHVCSVSSLMVFNHSLLTW